MDYVEIINSIIEEFELEFCDENEKEIFWNSLIEDVEEQLLTISKEVI